MSRASRNYTSDVSFRPGAELDLWRGHVGGSAPFAMIAEVEPVIEMLGALTPALAAVLASVNWELLSHHRSAVLKHHRFPGGRASQRMLGSRIFRYGAKVRAPVRIDDAVGEVFAAAESGETFGETAFVDWEKGRRIGASGYMAVPVGEGVKDTPKGRRATAKFRRLLTAREFRIAWVREGLGLLYVTLSGAQRRRRDVKRQREDGGTNLRTARRLVMGMLIRKRVQRPILDFYKRFDAVAPGHMKDYESAVALALTEAGRIKLERRAVNQVEAERRGAEAFTRMKSAMLGGGYPSGHAKRAAAIARRRAIQAYRAGRDD